MWSALRTMLRIGGPVSRDIFDFDNHSAFLASRGAPCCK
jgi:hypothetical protein